MAISQNRRVRIAHQLQVEADQYFATNELEEAERVCKEIIRILQDELDPFDLDLVIAWNSLARVFEAEQKLTQAAAAESYARALLSWQLEEGTYFH